MSDTFDGPQQAYNEQNRFSREEVGLTHPKTPAFIRLCNNGDIEIVAGEGCSIIMNPRAKSITFVADTFNVLTKEGGFHWNGKAFNEMATGFQEPTFVEPEDGPDLYRGADYYTNEGGV